MNEFNLAMCVLLLLMIVAGLLRILHGPTPGDRMLAAQLFGTSGVAVVLLFAFAMELPRLLDLALVFAVLAAVVGIAFALRGWVEPRSSREDPGES